MAEFPNKFQNMVDEMTRFEEEIGLPYKAEMPPGRIPSQPGRIPSQPFVLGTNTFSQAQQKILQIHQVGPNMPSFIPAQVLHASQAGGPIPGGIPPPPPPPLSMPPAGMRFPPGMPIPYTQPIAASTPAPAPTFPSSLVMRPEPATNSVPVTPASPTTLARRTAAAATWPNRTPAAPAAPTTAAYRLPVPKLEAKPNEEVPKVVLSATPKLYTPKVDKVDDSMSRLIGLDIPKSNNDMGMAKKMRPNDNKFNSPIASYISAVEAANLDRKKDKKKKFIRVSGGQTWEDATLTEWDDGDFRLFCGDLGNDVTDELLTRIFSRYPSFSKAKVVRDKRTNKTKGFGFISFKDPQDFIRASKEMNGRYVGSRPIKLRKSTWKNRNLDVVKKKEKEKAALIAMLTGKQ